MESVGHTPSEGSEQKRRSSRVFLSIAILISGPDFEVEAETIDVSSHGAKIRTSHRLNLGMEVGNYRIYGPIPPSTRGAARSRRVWE